MPSKTLNARMIVSGLISPQAFYNAHKELQIARHASFWVGILPLLMMTPLAVFIEGSLAGRPIGGLWVGCCALFAGTANFAACNVMLSQNARLLERPLSADACFVGATVLQLPVWLAMSSLMLPLERVGLLPVYPAVLSFLVLLSLRQSWSCFRGGNLDEAKEARHAWFGVAVGLQHIVLSFLIWGVIGLFAAALSIGLPQTPGH